MSIEEQLQKLCTVTFQNSLEVIVEPTYNAKSNIGDNYIAFAKALVGCWHQQAQLIKALLHRKYPDNNHAELDGLIQIVGNIQETLKKAEEHPKNTSLAIKELFNSFAPNKKGVRSIPQATSVGTAAFLLLYLQVIKQIESFLKVQMPLLKGITFSEHGLKQFALATLGAVFGADFLEKNKIRKETATAYLAKQGYLPQEHQVQDDWKEDESSVSAANSTRTFSPSPSSKSSTK